MSPAMMAGCPFRGGHLPAHSRDERREPALGSTADPRRTAQAWHRCRTDYGGKVHGEEKAATVAGLEDLSAQSCRRHCVDGFVRSPDDLVSAVVWISDLAAFPPPASVVGCDRAPERPLDCPSTDRSLRLATDATIYRSRSGLRLRRCRHPAASSNGYTARTYPRSPSSTTSKTDRKVPYWRLMRPSRTCRAAFVP